MKMTMLCDRCGEAFLLEELADIKVAFTVYLSDSKLCIKARVSEEINKTAEIKLDRWLSRLEEKEQVEKELRERWN